MSAWIPKVMWYCADGATVMQGARAGVFSFLCALQQEICGWSVVVPVHANGHRVDLAINTALDSGYTFVDTVAAGMQEATLFWNNSLARLPVLPTVATTLQTAVVKFRVLHDRNRCLAPATSSLPSADLWPCANRVETSRGA